MPTVPFHAPGITYNGLHSTPNPTASQVSADLATTKQHFGHVRTYYPQYGGGAVDVGKLANITAILIGNEDPQMIDTITQYLQKAKADMPQVPVGTSQTIGFWLTDGRAVQLLPLVDFIGVNIYPAWDWTRADAKQPIGVTPESGFNSFRDTYNQIQTKYSGRQIVVTETGWPTTFGPIPAQQFTTGISNARDYLNRVIAWAQAQQVVVYIHNMFDDQYGVDTSSPFNYHFGLIDYAGNPKGVLF
jgi:glucan 1,3-beta-glucosidase